MQTIILEKDSINQIVELLLQEEVIALPTETIYGLATIKKAETKLYELKGRDNNKPITYLLGDTASINKCALVNKRSAYFIKALLPGPVTLILPTLDGNSTIGFRVSAEPFLQAVALRCEQPISLTSANLSGEANLLTFDEVYSTFNQQIAGIVRGSCTSLIASTIIDLTKEEVTILRDGAVERTVIEQLAEEYKQYEKE